MGRHASVAEHHGHTETETNIAFDKFEHSNKCIDVHVSMEFVNVSSVDTQGEQFSAVIIIEAVWVDESLAGAMSSRVDWGRQWHPRLYLQHIEDEDVDCHVQMLLPPSKSVAPGTVRMSRQIRGNLPGAYNLRRFPFDSQVPIHDDLLDLNVSIMPLPSSGTHSHPGVEMDLEASEAYPEQRPRAVPGNA